MRITTLGDLLLDVIVRLERPLATGDDQTATTSTGPGGQAANVAAWAAALGAEARFVGRIGADAAGELLLRELRDRGVEVDTSNEIVAPRSRACTAAVAAAEAIGSRRSE